MSKSVPCFAYCRRGGWDDNDAEMMQGLFANYMQFFTPRQQQAVKVAIGGGQSPLTALKTVASGTAARGVFSGLAFKKADVAAAAMAAVQAALAQRGPPLLLLLLLR